MRTALMTVEAERDDVAAPGQTRIAQALCYSIPEYLRQHLLVSSAGHFSLFHGNTWRSRVLPAVVAFMKQAEDVPTKV